MPVDDKVLGKGEVLYQRQQYEKGGIGRLYWDYRDRKIMRYINGDEILDIGCGEGITLNKIINKFPQKKVLGIDYLIENVEICKKYNLPVERGDVYNLEFADESIDCCLLIEVIEHLTDYAKALKEIYRVLRNEGILIVLFPNDRNFKIARILTGKFKEAFYDAGHVKQWKPRLMKNVLETVNFNVLRIEFLPFLLWVFSLHSIVIAKK